MFGCFSEEVRKILVCAKEEMFKLNHPYVGSEHLLLSILKSDNDVSSKLKKYNLTYNIFRDELIKVVGIGKNKSEWFLYTPLLKRVLENSIIISHDNNSLEVSLYEVFLSLLEEGDGVGLRIVSMLGVNIDILYNDFVYKSPKKNKRLLVLEYGVDLTNNSFDPVIGRDLEIRNVIEILSRRTKNNPILIGEAGVGKTAIVEGLSYMIKNGMVPDLLLNKRIISIDMSSLVAGTKYRGEFESRINKIIKEVEDNDDIILFIDEIHTLVGAGGAEGAIDASNIFKPALARGRFRVIGATTMDEYKKYIEKDSALNRRFRKVLVSETDSFKTKNILMELKPIYEDFHHVKISDDMIDKIIYFADKYIYDRYNPDKSIDLLDEVCAKVNIKNTTCDYNMLKDIHSKKLMYLKNNDFKKAKELKALENEYLSNKNYDSVSLVTLNDIGSVIYDRTGIPVYEILHDLSDDDFGEIVGQDEAKKKLELLKNKIKLGYQDNYSILFCGSSGVGKTKLACMFGASFGNMIKLDMSEYMDPSSINKILGAPAGYVGYDDTSILDSIRNKPRCVLVVDEIEKAHPSIINLFLQILDDKKIKDNHGRVIRFDNVVIIFTSNVGFDKGCVGFNKRNMSDIKSDLKEYFSIPFINRLDDIIVFNDLDETCIKTLIRNKLSFIRDKYQSSINFNYDDDLVDNLFGKIDYRNYGARGVEKLIKSEVESKIIDSIIDKKEEVTI